MSSVDVPPSKASRSAFSTGNHSIYTANTPTEASAPREAAAARSPIPPAKTQHKMKNQNSRTSVSFHSMLGSCLFAAAVFLMGPPKASGQITNVHVDLSSLGFGDMSQLTPGIRLGNVACGPTAAINSFFYLQNHFGIQTLGPDNGLLTKDNAVSAINDIGWDMGLSEPNGVYFDNFIQGKKDYFTRHNAASLIRVESMWAPTWEWMYQQLAAGQDVEILFGWYDPQGGRHGGHFVTVTGFDFTDTNGNGNIDSGEAAMDFVDPWGGVSLVTDDFRMQGNQMNFHYTGGASGIYRSGIEGMIAESPVPEPATYGACGAGLLVVVAAIARRRRQR